MKALHLRPPAGPPLSTWIATRVATPRSGTYTLWRGARVLQLALHLLAMEGMLPNGTLPSFGRHAAYVA